MFIIGGDRVGVRVVCVGFKWVYAVAGVMNRDDKHVMISRQELVPIQRFTAAHELGHVVLKHQGAALHRDIPLDKAGVVRDRRELEANRFASSFLMPKKPLRKEFQLRFGSDRFQLDDFTAHALCGTTVGRVLKQYQSLRSLSMHIAGTATFNARHFLPLFTLFGVSCKAMAIRLEELGIVSSA